MHLSCRLLLSGILLIVSSSSCYGITSSNHVYAFDQAVTVAQIEGNPLYKEAAPIGVPLGYRIFIREVNSGQSTYRVEYIFDENGRFSNCIKGEQLESPVLLGINENKNKDQNLLNNITKSNISKGIALAAAAGLFAFGLIVICKTREQREQNSDSKRV